jgi:hypothetical protein
MVHLESEKVSNYRGVLISGLSCSCTDLEPAEGGDNGECHGQEYVGGREDCETGLSECADGEHADLPPNIIFSLHNVILIMANLGTTQRDVYTCHMDSVFAI